MSPQDLLQPAKSTKPCSEPRAGLEISAAPRERENKAVAWPRQQQRAAGWPWLRVQPTLAACLESVY